MNILQSITVVTVAFTCIPNISRSLELSPSYNVIEYYSNIKAGDADHLAKLLSDQPGPTIIYFNSVGGHISEAIRVGKVIRKHAAATYIPPEAQCTSACFLAFIGGKTRIVAPSAKLGSHQSYWKDENSPDTKLAVSVTQNIASKSLQHIIDMGISPEAYSRILGTPPDKMYLFDAQEILNFHISSD